MKKRKLKVLVCVFAIVVIVGILFIKLNEPSGLLKEYKVHIEDYSKLPDEEKIGNLGYIETEEVAIEKTELVMNALFGEEETTYLRPFYVEFDKKNKIWHVYNKPQFFTGEVHIIIEQVDGKVLSWWAG